MDEQVESQFLVSGEDEKSVEANQDEGCFGCMNLGSYER